MNPSRRPPANIVAVLAPCTDASFSDSDSASFKNSLDEPLSEGDVLAIGRPGDMGIVNALRHEIERLGSENTGTPVLGGNRTAEHSSDYADARATH